MNTMTAINTAATVYAAQPPVGGARMGPALFQLVSMIALLVWMAWRSESGANRIARLIEDAPRRAIEQRKEEVFTRLLIQDAEAKKAVLRARIGLTKTGANRL